MKNLLKKNYKLILGIILGVILTSGVVFAASISSNNVTFDNSQSGISATTVQGAIDDLYTKANQPKGKNNTVYFAFGEPTTSSTTDYTTLNKKTFLALNGGQKSVCIIRNSRLHCFDNNNWAIEKDHVQQVFSDISCSVDSSRVDCLASDFYCYGTSYGNVSCYDYSGSSTCYVLSDGSDYCS